MTMSQRSNQPGNDEQNGRLAWGGGRQGQGQQIFLLQCFLFVTEQSFESTINQGGVVQGGGVPWHAVGGGRSGRGLLRPLCNSLHRRTAPVEHR